MIVQNKPTMLSLGLVVLKRSKNRYTECDGRRKRKTDDDRVRDL